MDFCTIPCGSSGDTYGMQTEYMIILPSLLPKSRRGSSGYEKALEMPILSKLRPTNFLL
jgi:hypothetical protein